jgi:hypothetical protein
MNKSHYCAEVIEGSLHHWRSQSWKWNCFPSFGSLVLTTMEDRILFGIVYDIQTGSSDPHRLPFAYQKTEAELLRDQPQIFHFLQTTFSSLLLGYQEQDTIFYQWAPHPPKIHAFVKNADQDDYKSFFSNPLSIHVLFSKASYTLNVDELLLALLHRCFTMHVLSTQHIEDFIETFSLLIGNDYRRLKLFLQRMQPLLKKNFK